MEHISLLDAEDMFDDMLNETHETVKVFGIEFEASRVLKNCDPICYRIGLWDYMDSLYEQGYIVVGYTEEVTA